MCRRVHKESSLRAVCRCGEGKTMRKRSASMNSPSMRLLFKHEGTPAPVESERCTKPTKQWFASATNNKTHQLAAIRRRRAQESPRNLSDVNSSRAIHATTHAIGTPSKPTCNTLMNVQESGMTSSPVTSPTDIENRVSPEARIGAIETIAHPLMGSVAV